MASPCRAEEAAAGPPRRVPIPGRRLVGAALLALLPVAAKPLLGTLALFAWTPLALLALLVLVDIWWRPPRGAVRVRRQVGGLCHVGREGSYLLRLENRTDRKVEIELRERLPPGLEGAGLSERLILRGGEVAERPVGFVALERGEHSLPPLGLRVGQRWGFLEYQERQEVPAVVAVAPGRPRSETEWLLSRVAVLEEAGEVRLRSRGMEREFESLREYVAGDEIRRIDWKASARRHRPQVRQYETERNAEAILALDCGRLMGSLIGGVSKLDLTMTPLLDLAAVLLRRKERVGLLTFDSKPRAFVPPRGELSQLGALLSALARAPRGLEPTSYLRAVRYLESRHRKRTLVLVFTDFTDELSARELLASLEALRRRHVLVFIAVGDPHLERIAEGPARGVRGWVEKAVAAELLVERRRTLAGLERLGVFTVEATPERLTAPLVGRYLEVRLRGAV